MKRPYLCGTRRFATLAEASAFASRVFQKTGIVLGIERRG